MSLLWTALEMELLRLISKMVIILNCSMSCVGQGGPKINELDKVTA